MRVWLTVLIVGAGLMAAACGGSKAESPAARPELAPDIALATVDGGGFLLSENRGEVLLLYFSFPG